ncbi:EcoAI/FtnUII family type I restriction enzme subunit R [Hippea jasoniae]|uniref:EcoAI/FtnUII family type I restriction enzme subunit R n=1 Tax=Hippea jasoniae TaxID=944479 RepID=UPI000551701A|nr:DEAD/DEAH box helicase family protein [Hippea jasoniae]
MPLNEAETKAKLIEPKLKEVGWTEEDIEREYIIKQDRFYVRGEEYEKIKPKKRFADYVLKVNNIIVSVIEAKAEDKLAEEGLAQAKEYAELLDVPIAFSTNGKEILMYDRRLPKTQNIESFLSKDELFQIYKEWKNLIDKNLSPLEYPFYIAPDKKIRNYQEVAIRRVIEAILKNQKRILLTMATGTGKTFTSFQIVWKLIKSHYFSRILFLTDRIFLRDQAHDFYEPFKDARYKIKSGNFNKNRKIYFSTYQSLYADDFYKNIPNDFFDLIIIDECHRSRYGEWGEILEYFNTAYHLGMTATPKREDNIDVYEYFGEPVFVYSMAQAIEDGYLVPYKIYKITTNIDKTGVKIDDAEEIIYDDEINPDEDIKDFYFPSEFEREITLPDRTEIMCKKFLEILKKTKDEFAKTIIFCVDTIHAEAVRDTLNKMKNKENFATKIVYEDKDDLTVFRDSERIYPLVATTVDLLSTGVDIPHLKNIVFMRPISSRVLFKQIIGRGSRIAPEKGFFRIIDFTNATRLIDEWDVPKKIKHKEIIPEEPFDKIIEGKVADYYNGEPLENVKIIARVGRWDKFTITDKNGFFQLSSLPSNEFIKLIISKDGYYTINKNISPNSTGLKFELKSIKKKAKKIILKGINVIIEEEIQIEIDGNYISFAEYKKYVESNLKKEVHTLNELKEIWIDDKRRKEFLEHLKDKNIDIDFLKELDNLGHVDSFDIIARIIFNAPLITKDERIKYFVNKHLSKIDKYGEEIRYIVLRLLEKYKLGGIDDISPKALKTPDMEKISALNKLRSKFDLKTIPVFFNKLKEMLFELEQAG